MHGACLDGRVTYPALGDAPGKCNSPRQDWLQAPSARMSRLGSGPAPMTSACDEDRRRILNRRSDQITVRVGPLAERASMAALSAGISRRWRRANPAEINGFRMRRGPEGTASTHIVTVVPAASGTTS